MNTYPNTEIPKVSPDDDSFSVDVICVDDDGMMCIAHYDFELAQWTFLTDSLYEGYKDVMVWAYRPEEFIAPPKN